MAEGFARAYGADIMEIHSAGLAPTISIPEATRRTMAEKGIDISGQFPKALDVYPPGFFDIVLNMSGHPLEMNSEVRDWKVRDPYTSSDRVYRDVRDQIETLVMKLILELRQGRA